MSDTNHVTPEQAHRLFVELEVEGYRAFLGLSRQRDLARTVATEPRRIRTAVVEALRNLADEAYEGAYLTETSRLIAARADAIEAGADW